MKTKRKTRIKVTETDIKRIVIDYLDLMHISHYHNLQGLGCYPGLPDRVMHYRGRVHYLEIKTPAGKLSQHQQDFRDQCLIDGIGYHVIRSLEDIQWVVEDGKELKGEPHNKAGWVDE